MMEALGAIAAEPGEVPDCNCAFFDSGFIFHTHTHPPTLQARAQGSVCGGMPRFVG